jgi:hypothetical protein
MSLDFRDLRQLNVRPPDMSSQLGMVLFSAEEAVPHWFHIFLKIEQFTGLPKVAEQHFSQN